MASSMPVARWTWRWSPTGRLAEEPSSLSSSPRSSARSALADALGEVAAAHNATAAQVALAWLLKRDDHVIPIPGATRPEHVRENAGALSLELSQEEVVVIDQASAPTPSR